MHYYKFNISDWALATSHLTILEELVYFKLINYYYDTEQPIPADLAGVLRRLRLSEQAETVKIILDEFFIFDANSWRHERCEQEIADYKALQNSASMAGKASAAKRALNRISTDVERSLDLRCDYVQPTINHKPITIKQFIKPSIDDLKKHILEKGLMVDAEKFFAFYESNGWKVGKNPMKNWQMALVTWNKSSDAHQPVKTRKVIGQA